MGNRLTKIYTRTGDDGKTGLGDNTRVDKDSARVEAYGTLDELNSAIGMIIAEPDLPEPHKDLLITIQHHLFDLGGEFCLPDYQAIDADHILLLEKHLDLLNEDLPALKEFILPGGHKAAAICHLARTICRRAERRAVTLNKIEPLKNPQGLIYLNRLSDFLFVLARSINHSHQIAEPLWQHERVKRG